VEPAAAAERHPQLSHAQQSQSLTVNLKNAVTWTARKPNRAIYLALHHRPYEGAATADAVAVGEAGHVIIAPARAAM
jgi:hypothetical protein